MRNGVSVLNHDTGFRNIKKYLVKRYGKNTDMYIWHGIKSDVERKLARDIRKWQDAGYAFTYKVFTNVGHGGLIAEHTEQFIEEVKASHASSPRKGDGLC